ncbi:MAG: hypothetical protein QW083_03450 [Methanomassiliicoccales archaeon]
MEVLRITGKNTQSIFPRVISELVRRKVELHRVFFHGDDAHVEMIIEVRNSSLNGKLLHALRAIQDVTSADYVENGLGCPWELDPRNELATKFTNSMSSNRQKSHV